ncbi:hypothetical protein Tco_1205086 [Tanacetum coccineum]
MENYKLYLPNEKLQNELQDIEHLTEERIDEIIQWFLRDIEANKLLENGWPLTVGYVITDITSNTGELTSKEDAKAPVMVVLLPDDGPLGVLISFWQYRVEWKRSNGVDCSSLQIIDQITKKRGNAFGRERRTGIGKNLMVHGTNLAFLLLLTDCRIPSVSKVDSMVNSVETPTVGFSGDHVPDTRISGDYVELIPCRALSSCSHICSKEFAKWNSDHNF